MSFIGLVNVNYDSIQKTIFLLQNTRNPLAVPVLGSAIPNVPEPVRSRILAALVARGDAASMDAIAKNYHLYNEKERAMVATRARQLSKLVLGLLDGSDSERKAAIEAICHLEVMEGVRSVIAIAENKGDPLAVYAQDRIYNWGLALNQSSRSQSRARTELVEHLYQSLQRFDQHGCSLLVDALLATMRWDDSAVGVLLRTTTSRPFEHFLKTLRQSSRKEAIQLLIESLHQRQVPRTLLDLFYERKDKVFTEAFGNWAAKGLCTNARMNLVGMRELPCFQSVQANDTEWTSAVRRGVWTAYAAAGAPLHQILQAVLQFLGLKTADDEATACILLSSLPPISFEKGVRDFLSIRQCDTDQVTHCYVQLLEEIPHQPKPVQKAIKQLFSEFHFQAFIHNLDRWDELRLRSIANVVKTVDDDWPTQLQEYLTSLSPKKRETGLIAAMHIGIATDAHWDAVVEAIYDEQQPVRLRAISLLPHCRQLEVENILHELLHDNDSSVRDAAETSLEQRFMQVHVGEFE